MRRDVPKHMGERVKVLGRVRIRGRTSLLKGSCTLQTDSRRLEGTLRMNRYPVSVVGNLQENHLVACWRSLGGDTLESSLSRDGSHVTGECVTIGHRKPKAYVDLHVNPGYLDSLKVYVLHVRELLLQRLRERRVLQYQ